MKIRKAKNHGERRSRRQITMWKRRRYEEKMNSTRKMEIGEKFVGGNFILYRDQIGIDYGAHR
jgi:hypothetical protein